MMTKRLKTVTMGLLLGACGVAGCGSSAPSKPFPQCGLPDFNCDTSGVPFAQAVFATTDYCGGLVAECGNPLPPVAGATTADLTKQGGQICLSGSIAMGGNVSLIVGFSQWNADITAIEKSFDASALGIAEVDFTVDSPLTGIVTASATTTPTAPVDCADATCFSNYLFGTAPNSGITAQYPAPGPEVAPFANLYLVNGAATAFDPVALENISFGPPRGFAGDYAFCISDIRFRDAAGNEVKP